MYYFESIKNNFATLIAKYKKTKNKRIRYIKPPFKNRNIRNKSNLS